MAIGELPMTMQPVLYPGWAKWLLAAAQRASGLGSREFREAIHADLVVGGHGWTTTYARGLQTYWVRGDRCLSAPSSPCSPMSRAAPQERVEQFLLRLIMLGRRADASRQSKIGLLALERSARVSTTPDKPPGDQVLSSGRIPRAPDS